MYMRVIKNECRRVFGAVVCTIFTFAYVRFLIVSVDWPSSGDDSCLIVFAYNCFIKRVHSFSCMFYCFRLSCANWLRMIAR